MKRFFIARRLPGLNEVIGRNRAHRQAGARLKREVESDLAWELGALNLPRLSGPHHWRFTWVCQDRRRDPDNIASAAKFIFDALQAAGVIENDGWSEIASIHHTFENGPRDGVWIEARDV